MSTSTVPIFDPQGVARDVPYEQAKDAIAAGGKPGVFMQSPDGKTRVVPASMTQQAVAAGGKVIPFDQQPANDHPGFWNSAAEDALSIPKGIMGMLPPVLAYNSIVHAKENYDSLQATGKTTEQIADAQRKEAGHGLAYRVLAPGAAQAVGVNLPGMEQSAEQGDVGGVLGHTVVPAATAAAPIVGEAAIAAKRGIQASPVGAAMVDAAGAAAKKLPAAAVRRIPYAGDVVADTYQAGAEAYRNAKNPPKPGTPIYRDATAENKVPYAGEEVPDKPVVRERDATRQNVEFAGEDIPEKPKPTPAGQFSFQADAKSLASLKQATTQLVDSAVPSSTNHGVNLMTKAQIDMKLRAGDVSGAEQILDSAAKKVTPGYMAPERPEIVPATQNIRENEALSTNAQQKGRTGGYREAQDDAGVSQEMRGNLDRHGVMAEQEARREFIARNSLGTTKGEMAQQVTTKAVDSSKLTLQEKLQLMLDAARAAKQ